MFRHKQNPIRKAATNASRKSVLGKSSLLSQQNKETNPSADPRFNQPYVYDPRHQDNEGPFGVVDEPTSRTKPHRMSGLKSVSVQNTESLDTNQVSSGMNTLSIPQEYIDSYEERISKTTHEIIDILMAGESSYLLALESASTHVQAILRDGFGVDADIDYDVMSVISDIGKLSVVFHALKKSRLPVKYKSMFFRKFLTCLSKASCDSLVNTNNKAKKREDVMQRLRDLEVLIKNRNIPKQSVSPGRKQDDHSINPITGVKRTMGR